MQQTGGIFLNIDINTVTFPFLSRVAKKDSVTETDLFPFVDQYKGTEVTDLAFNIFCQISMTPSRVWSDALDSYHRTTENGKPVDYTEILDHYHRLYEVHGIDPHKVWLARCRDLGITSWLSVRMNDCHCPDNDAVWIRGSEFYEADEKGWKIGDAYGYQRHCFNYAVPEVRAKMLAYLREQVLTYDADGLELDFSREWYCFDYVSEPDCAAVMTAFIREIREMLHEAEAKWGHKMLLHMRFMRDIEQNRVLGFDAEAIVDEGLIDSLSISPRWASCDSGLPVRAWKARFPNFPVYATVTDLTLLYPTDYATAAGYAASYLTEGADKIYLYNFFTDPDNKNEAYAQMHRTCGHLSTLWDVPRRFVVTRQDILPAGCDGYFPLPALADGFSILLPHAPVPADTPLRLVLGFERAIAPAEVAPTVNGVSATYLGETEEGALYGAGLERFAGKPLVVGRYLYEIPAGTLSAFHTIKIALTACDASLSLTYLEFIFGNIPKAE